MHSQDTSPIRVKFANCFDFLKLLYMHSYPAAGVKLLRVGVRVNAVCNSVDLKYEEAWKSYDTYCI